MILHNNDSKYWGKIWTILSDDFNNVNYKRKVSVFICMMIILGVNVFNSHEIL